MTSADRLIARTMAEPTKPRPPTGTVARKPLMLQGSTVAVAPASPWPGRVLPVDNPPCGYLRRGFSLACTIRLDATHCLISVLKSTLIGFAVFATILDRISDRLGRCAEAAN